MKDGKFEVGDRVDHYKPDLGSIRNGVIKEINKDAILVYWDNGARYWCRKTDCSLVQSITATITINSTKYKILKEISGKSIWDGGKYSGCKEWCEGFDIFVMKFGFNIVISTDNRDSSHARLKEYLQLRPNHLQWLIDNKYLRKVEKKMVKKSISFDGLFLHRIKHTDVDNNFEMEIKGMCSIDKHKSLSETMMTRNKFKMTLEWEEEE